MSHSSYFDLSGIIIADNKKDEKKNERIKENMPNYKGHLAGGVVVFAMIFTGMCIMYKPSLSIAIEWLVFTLAGALFPDIDIKSKGQKYFYYIVFFAFIILAARKQFITVTCCSFLILSPMLVRHRGIFHHPLFVIAVPILVWAFLSTLTTSYASKRLLWDTMFFIAGALSHIWLDIGTRHMLRGLFGRKKRW